MMKDILLGRRFWIYLVLPQLVFLAIALPTTGVFLIPVLNIVIFALSTGICVAFAPGVIVFFQGSGPLKTANALGLGIFCTWFATALFGIWGLIWRYKGQPLWMSNSDVVSYFRFLNICGAVLHMAAPGAITDRIPPARWVRIGIIVAIAVVGFFIIGYALSVFTDVPNIP